MARTKWLIAGAFLLLPCAFLIRLEASSFGISGFSGDPATGGLTCNKCHSGGATPSVTLSGPTLVQPGETNIYTLTVGGGQEVAGGLDVSASEGVLAIADLGTYLLGGEVVHNTPRMVNAETFEATWSFRWTAPLTAGEATLYAAGNSVNLMAGSNGDAANTDALTITVGGNATPGEVSGPGRAPLLVTGYDRTTGNLSVSYNPACGTTDNNIYFGMLDQVAAVSWSGETCNIGVSGTYAEFNPGSESYFFIVVGNEGASEGSYGTEWQVDGTEVEREPFPGNSCGQSQDLSQSCDSNP
jgi:hypothetical protein